MVHSHLSAVSKSLNFPTAARLHQELHKRGLRIHGDTVTHFVKQQAFRRPYAPAHIQDNTGKKYRKRDHSTKPGVYNSGRPRSRWFLDILQFPATEASRGFKYILLALDSFSRRLFGRVLGSKSGTQTARALQGILTEAGTPPSEIISDNGLEFKNPEVSGLLERRNIEQTFREKNDYSVSSQLDAGIRNVKRAIALRKAEDPEFEWAAHLQEVLKAENSAPRAHLHGGSARELDRFGSPDMTESDAVLGFYQEREAADRLGLNERNIDRREERLRRAGTFDVALHKSTFRRGHHARWETGKRVAWLQGNAVRDETGKLHQVRRVRAA